MICDAYSTHNQFECRDGGRHICNVMFGQFCIRLNANKGGGERRHLFKLRNFTEFISIILLQMCLSNAVTDK